MYISSQKALTSTFSRVFYFGNKNCVLNYAMNYRRPFICRDMLTCGGGERQETLRKTRQNKDLREGRGENRREGKSCIYMVTRGQQRHALHSTFTGFSSRPYSLRRFLLQMLLSCGTYINDFLSQYDKRNPEIMMSEIVYIYNFAINLGKFYFG